MRYMLCTISYYCVFFFLFSSQRCVFLKEGCDLWNQIYWDVIAKGALEQQHCQLKAEPVKSEAKLV